MPLKGKIDFRSDTFTEPTPEMRHAMATCEVGDDVWELDPTVKELEALGAKITGMEASLFMPSSIMANLVAVMTHTTGRGEEMLIGDKSHLSLYEQGHISTIAAVHARTVTNFDDGTFDIEELKMKIRPPGNFHFPRTSLVCLESSHNMCSGSAIPVEFIRKVQEAIKGKNIKLHIDGARMFNATTALGISPIEYLKGVDSINFCLSKALCAPIGAMLAGSKEFIDRARYIRKGLGGGLRQAGVIACCGIIALRDMVGRLGDDHARARRLYEGLKAIDGVQLRRADTNIVMFDLNKEIFKGASLGGVVKELNKHNVYMYPVDDDRVIRAVVHYHITDEDIEKSIVAVKSVLSAIRLGSVHVDIVDRNF